MARYLMIQFQGICAFIKQPDGSILVALPDTSKVEKRVSSMKPHHAFIRWEKADAATKGTTLKATAKGGYRAATLLKKTPIKIEGPILSGPLVVKSSFIKQIPDMGRLLPGAVPQTSKGIRAYTIIDRGVVEATPEDAGHFWTFNPYGAKSKKTLRNAPGPSEYSNRVTWTLKIDLTQGPIQITTDRRKLLITGRGPGDVQIVIGNLEQSFPVSRASKRRPKDVDFLCQYEIAQVPPKLGDRFVPTRTTKHKTRGARVECFAARWGDFQVGDPGKAPADS